MQCLGEEFSGRFGRFLVRGITERLANIMQVLVQGINLGSLVGVSAKEVCRLTSARAIRCKHERLTKGVRQIANNGAGLSKLHLQTPQQSQRQRC